MRTNIYIDGFNFFYLAVKDTPYKWLDIESLFTKILDPKRNQINQIKYFTALVDGKKDPDKPKRQDAYLRALRAYTPDIQIYRGYFATNIAKRDLVNPIDGIKAVRVYDPKEKGSDVNLAVHVLNDAWLGAYDCAFVVSNDSDIKESLKIVSRDLKKVIGWVYYDTADPRYYRPSKVLKRYATFIKHITVSKIRASQLPEKIPGTKIVKPKEWY